MLIIRDRQVSIMILFAISLHLWWCAMVMIDDNALHATGLASLYRYIHPPALLVTFLVGAVSMAAIALMTQSPWIVFLLLPQQVILMMSAAGAIEAMWIAQFADGVIRPRAFIAADQFYSVLAAIGHTAAIIAHSMRRWISVNE